MSVTIYGHSDDLIEVYGDIEEEFSALGDDETGGLLAFSDGTVLRIKYGNEGIWRINIVTSLHPEAIFIKSCLEDDGESYSDRAVIDTGSTIKWVVFGSQFVKGKK